MARSQFLRMNLTLSPVVSLAISVISTSGRCSYGILN
jgi:hypothetical protein